MNGRNLHSPQQGDTPSAAWARELIGEVRSHRLAVTYPLALSRTPEGTTLRLASSPALRQPVAEPFDIAFSGAVCTFTNCDIPHGTVTTLHADITYEVTGADGDIWLALKIDTENYTAEIIEGATKASVVDQTIPADKYIRRLLYRVFKATSGTPAVVSLTKTYDGRRNPVQVAYV